MSRRRDAREPGENGPKGDKQRARRCNSAPVHPHQARVYDGTNALGVAARALLPGAVGVAEWLDAWTWAAPTGRSGQAAGDPLSRRSMQAEYSPRLCQRPELLQFTNATRTAPVHRPPSTAAPDGAGFLCVFGSWVLAALALRCCAWLACWAPSPGQRNTEEKQRKAHAEKVHKRRGMEYVTYMLRLPDGSPFFDRHYGRRLLRPWTTSSQECHWIKIASVGCPAGLLLACCGMRKARIVCGRRAQTAATSQCSRIRIEPCCAWSPLFPPFPLAS